MAQLSIQKKIDALSWIPNGEVDDTRFEKLYDELAKAIECNSDQVLQLGLLPALEVSLNHEDERIRSISTRLLGNLSVASPSQATLGLVSRHLSSISDKSKLAKLEHVELEAASFFVFRWIPHLSSSEIVQSRLYDLISFCLSSSSHFVRSSVIDAATQVFNRTDFQNLASKLINDIPRLSEVRTALDLLSSASTSPSLIVLLQGHPSIFLLWNSLENQDDLLVAETARCCLRSIIYSSDCSILLEPRDIESLFTRLTLKSTKKSISNAIALLLLRPVLPSQPNANTFYQWCANTVTSLITFCTSTETATSQLFLDATLRSIFIQHRDHVIDSTTSTLLLSHQNGILPSNLISKILSRLVREALNCPARYAFHIKLAHLLVAYWPSLVPNPDDFLQFTIISLRNTSAPLNLKMILFSLLESMVKRPGESIHWVRILPELLTLRFSPSWEMRDSLNLFFAQVLLNAVDVASCVDHHLLPAILSGLLDEIEHVRATTLTTLGTLFTFPFFAEEIQKIAPTVLQSLFTNLDYQDSSRIAQCKSICQILASSHLDTEIDKIDKIKFCKILNIAISDEDYEVRQSVILILGTMIQHYARLQPWWNEVHSTDLLLLGISDSSRIVRLESWKLVKIIAESRLLTLGAQEFKENDLTAITQIIADQDVEESYDPDDEVYPLAPGQADNDLDCPY